MHSQVWELDGAELKLVKEVEKPSAFKCGTFGASSIVERRCATGNFEGKLQIWDLEQTQRPVSLADMWSAHTAVQHSRQQQTA